MTSTDHDKILDLLDRLERDIRDAQDNRTLSPRLYRSHLESAERTARGILGRIQRELDQSRTVRRHGEPSGQRHFQRGSTAQT